MSIFFDFDIGPCGRRFRRAVDGDKYDIESMESYQVVKKFFGDDIDIGSLIELSPLSICMIDEKNEVIGFMALNDHPNVPGVDPSDWEFWVRNMFQKYYLSRNTLFVHFMCCANVVSQFFSEEAFKSVFENDVYLQHIIVVIPHGGSEVTEFISKYFSGKKYKVLPVRQDIYNNGIHLYTALRRDYYPNITIRRAVEEDNDDIVNILGKDSSRLQDLYGDFYISEIIGRHPEMNRKIIVAENYDQVVGVMCLNSDINYEMLQNTYELGPFHGLKKVSTLKKEQDKRNNNLLRTFGDPIMTGKWSPFEDNITQPRKSDTKVQDKYVESQSKKISKVNFNQEEEMRRSMSRIYYNPESEDLSEEIFCDPQIQAVEYPRTSIVECLLEEDPFDYEIINIDNNLLTMAEVYSCTNLLLPKRLLACESTQSERSSIKNNRHERRRRYPNNKSNNIEENTVKYPGEPNAFIIELYGMHSDISDIHGFELLQEAFEIMSDYEYCLIRVPCVNKSFNLLQHFCFVPTKNRICCDYALYLAHRCSVISKLRVRKAEIVDIPQVTNLLQSLEGKETMWTIESTILKKNELECYVFMSGMSLVGIGILELPEQIDFIRVKFNMDALRIHKYHRKGDLYSGFGTLKQVLIYPAFEPHYRFFARDMLRLSGFTTLMWLTAYRNKWITHKANSLIGVMIPLMPRKSEIDCVAAPELRRIQKIANNIMAFSAWFISRKITTIPKVNVDTRIVIVGASRTAIAFINSLIFGDSSTYLTFTNVTLVSPDGLPYLRTVKTKAAMMFTQHCTSTDQYLKSVPYTYYVNVVQGTMDEINRKEKYIKLTNNGKCYYDMLFLLLGKQYQYPSYMNCIINKQKFNCNTDSTYRRLDVPYYESEPSPCVERPDNVFVINNIHNADRALNYIKMFDWSNSNSKIIVYGATIEAYCCITTLIESEVPCENIIFVEPFPDPNVRRTRVPVFANIYVDKTVGEVLDNLKIEIHRSFYYQSWNLDYNNSITHVEFISQTKQLRLECAALFFYGIKGVNEHAFIAINKSGMVYDGGLLIDHQFMTMDPAIYAAGPITRYQRRYYAAAKRQKHYDSYEVGAKLGSQIRNKLDPLFTEKEKQQIKSIKRFVKYVSFESTASGESERFSLRQDSRECEDIFKLPDFKLPLIMHCSLPGDLNYLEVRSPGKKVPHHFVQSLNYSGYVLETFKNGYFKLHLNNDLKVDGITCLSNKSYPFENFKKLYGCSSAMLNNVYLRYATKKLDNLYDFFQSPWASYLYHDQTEELLAMVKELMPKGNRHGETLREALQTVGKSVGVMSNQFSNFDVMHKIRSCFEQTPHVEAITDYVIEWLAEHEGILSMYMQPSQKSHFAGHTNMNPAFKKKKRKIVEMLNKII